MATGSPNEHRVINKLKVGRTIILESSYDLYDEYILEDYKYKNGTNPNSKLPIAANPLI